MSSWFDRLLEELQQRQAEADARREGRPLPPRRGEPRNVTPIEEGRRRGANGGAEGDEPPPADLLPWRRWLIWGGIVLGALFILGLLGGLLNLVTDIMWYDALERRDVLTTRLFAQLGLFAVGLAAFLIPAVISILVARRIAPQEPLKRVGWLELPDASRLITWGLIVLAVFMALGSAAAWSASWEMILLFVNGSAWGVADETLGRDVGFYIFDLPFWRFLQAWVVNSVIVIGLLTLGAYAAGSLRWQFRLSAPVRAHLSVIGAIVLVGVAIGYQLDIAELVYSRRGVGGAVQMASYTDVNAQLPAYVILTVVAAASAVILLLNTWFRTLWLLGLAVVAWIGLSILVGVLYPNAVQRFQVDPNELAVERPFLAQHLAATRAAHDLDAIEARPFTGEEELTRELFDANEATVENFRLWDYRPLLTTFGQQQILRQYYNFLDVDIDRYEVEGRQRQIMLSARELEVERLPSQARTWTNEALVFTHGYGLTAVPVASVTSQGQPNYLISGIDFEPRLPVGEPRIYFGEATDTYVVTNTDTAEFDYPLEDREDDATTVWRGTTGVGIGNPLARALFALRFGDLNLLISGQLTGESEILFRRGLQERVREIAPFLAYDNDPYLVSAGDRLVWIWDAYTVSDRYPNAQPLPEGRFEGANYVRNAVKVVVDAYDGTVRFFIADDRDPIIAAYARIFPGLFEPLSAMPEEYVAHLRYPEDLFTAQNTAYLIYHLPATERGATTFYNQEDRWAFPEETTSGTGIQPMEPYYVTMRIPGEEDVEFTLIQPLVAERRPNMVSWVAARMDPGVYGQRISFRFPATTTTLGPQQVEARIDQDDTISAQFTLWDRAGSQVIRGNLLVLPFGDDGLLYIEPIFLQATQARFPEFVRIIMVSQERVAFAESVEEGIRQLLGEAPLPPPEEPEEPPPGEEPTDPEETPGEVPGDVGELIAEAQRLYDLAQAALGRGDLGEYQRRVDELGEVLDRIAELSGQ